MYQRLVNNITFINMFPIRFFYSFLFFYGLYAFFWKILIYYYYYYCFTLLCLILSVYHVLKFHFMRWLFQNRKIQKTIQHTTKIPQTLQFI